MHTLMQWNDEYIYKNFFQIPNLQSPSKPQFDAAGLLVLALNNLNIVLWA
jgi:hypothetical protein